VGREVIDLTTPRFLGRSPITPNLGELVFKTRNKFRIKGDWTGKSLLVGLHLPINECIGNDVGSSLDPLKPGGTEGTCRTRSPYITPRSNQIPEVITQSALKGEGEFRTRESLWGRWRRIP